MTRLRYLARVIMCIPLLPFIYLEGRRVEAKIPKLPEAEGPIGTSGIGSAVPVRMLLIGESTIAGVGVKNHNEGFAGGLGGELAKFLGRRVHWRVHARSGYTVDKINREILPGVSPDPTDLILVGVGANDAFKLSTLRKWRRSIRFFVSHLRDKFPDVPIVFVHMPPLNEFPVFTPLLRFSIGALSKIFGDDLVAIVHGLEGVWFAGNTLSIADWKDRYQLDCSVDDLFSDGVHPSHTTYQLWSKDLCQFIAKKDILSK